MQLCHGPLKSNYRQLLPGPREEHGNVERGKSGMGGIQGWYFHPFVGGIERYQSIGENARQPRHACSKGPCIDAVWNDWSQWEVWWMR